MSFQAKDPRRLAAYHLPGMDALPASVRTFGGDDRRPFAVEMADLTADVVREQVERLLQSRRAHLSERPVLEIAGAIGRVAERFLDPSSPLRRSAVHGVGAVTGLSRPMVDRVLDGMAKDWREDSLRDLLHQEFGEPRVLDQFIRLPGSAVRTRVFGPELTFHVFSGNVPGVSVTSLIRSLLVKSAALCKTGSGEPILAPLFARALEEEDSQLASCVAVAYWPGGDEALEAAALERAEAVISYGGRQAVESIRARVRPGARFLAYAHRVSFGVLLRESLSKSVADRLAEAAARAVGTFDQQGCVSPHLFYVEEGGEMTPAEWAARLAGAMERLEAELPRGRIAPAESAAIRQARADAEFGVLAGSQGATHTSPDSTAWTVIYDADAAFQASCLNRLVRVKPIGSITDLMQKVRPIASVLQTVGIAGEDERVARLAAELGKLGASRITPIEEVPWPPPAWHHDGRPPLGDLVRWCDWE